ncbi:MAG TPA: hypothetical protein VGK52_08510 [Polyangia bacterium]|jgi:hypothetical protein
MSQTHFSRLFNGAAICFVGGVLACSSSSPYKAPPGTTGGAGSTGTSAGTAGTGAAGTGAAGSAGSAGSAAGGTGTAGDSGGDNGGSTGAAGDSSTGAAGTSSPPVDRSITTSALPVAVTAYWYPSGWDGDPATVSQFTAKPAPITIEDQTTTKPTTGPCANRVAGAVGDCFKITYTPVAADGGSTHASVGLIPAIPNDGRPSFDPTVAPHVPPGAMKMTAQVAGDVGGEAVTFNLWGTDQIDLFTPTLPAGQAWQKLSLPLTGVAYDKVQSPFGWYSASTTPIVFYYDDIRIDNAP